MSPAPRQERATQRYRHIAVRGHSFRVSVRTGTDPSRRPLVLCNGIGASIELLQPFVARLPKEWTVIRFDVPGVGGSPMPRLPYTFATLGCSVIQLLDVLGVSDFDVLGMSWGGGLAQQIAVTNPRRCRRLVLVGTATGALMIPARPSVLLKMMTPRRYRDPSYARKIAPEVYGGSLRKNPEQATGLLQKHLHLGSRRGYAYQLAAMASWTSLPALPFIRQPTLVLAGTDDPIIPVANARVLGALIPKAQVHLYDNGHLALLTDPEQVVEPLKKFLDSE